MKRSCSQVKAGFPQQLTFEPHDSLQLFDAMSLILSRPSPAEQAGHALPDAVVEPSASLLCMSVEWLQEARQRLVLLAPETLIQETEGQHSLYISRAAARQYEQQVKAELEHWARGDKSGMQLVQEVRKVELLVNGHGHAARSRLP